MLEAIIRGALRHRIAVLGVALALLVLGGWQALRTPVDVLPDLTAPTVTVLTECPGMAPQEVELLVTFPIESALNGAPGLRRVRSVSAAGLSVVWSEFDWDQEVYRARQVVSERLQTVDLPATIERPQLGPISSIMGEITFLAITSASLPPIELRTLAETTIRRSLLAVPGISQVVAIGGDVRQFQVELDPGALARHRTGLDEVLAALGRANSTPAAGFHVDAGQEYLVRGLGRAKDAADLAATVVHARNGVPLTVGQLGTVREGPEPKRGTAAYKARPAVVLSVQKQPGANTLEVTRRIDRALEDLAARLPAGVSIEKENFRQADFIAQSIHNVGDALRDGAILVVIILLLFLGNVRATLISGIAIPLSLIAGVLVVRAFGGTINTMTLGGLTIAIGALVDDAIIDVENVFRRLRQERQKPEGERRPALEVVFRASSEVRQAILFATLIIVVVFLPLFVLPGMEGRLLQPLGLAYVAALAASLLVSLTVTPVLCLFLLPTSKGIEGGETRFLRWLLRVYEPSLRWSMRRPAVVLGVSALLLAGAVATAPFLGRSFLPPFNEGSLTVAVVSAPGITLDDSDALAGQVERTLLAFPEVVSTSRRTGRAERDEHVQGVNGTEMEIVLRKGRPKPELLAEMRRAVSVIPGVTVTFGQPISHRIDHMISGSKSSLAVKAFGPDLAVLRRLGGAIEAALRKEPGIVDVSNQEQASVAELVLDFDRVAMARHGVDPESMSRAVEALFQGTPVGEVFADGLVSGVIVRMPESLRGRRDQLAALPVAASSGALLRLGDLARVRFDLGPSLVRREDVERVAMVTANVSGADLAGTVARARERVAQDVEPPPGYRITFGGQFETAARTLRALGLLSAAAFGAVYLLLFLAFRSHRNTVIVLVNQPLALIGGVFAAAIFEGALNVASLVGFITLFGIATRNGVLLVSHYGHLMEEEGLALGEAIRRGSRERLSPVLMTALTAGLALIPLVVAADAPGKEILSPMAQVILGGLLSSTFLNMIVVPVLFARWGERADAAGA